MYEIQLHPGERIILTIRKHWLIYVGMLIPFALITYLPLFLIDFIQAHSIMGEAATIALSLEGPGTRFVVGAWWLIVWMGFFSAVSRNFLDVWILTNQRIVMIEQHKFFKREVLNIILEHVQDVRSEVHGFFPTIFGFGTIDVDSAGPSPKNFKMQWAYRPLMVRDEVMKHLTSMYKGSNRSSIIDSIV
jgi:hypothetical protein